MMLKNITQIGLAKKQLLQRRVYICYKLSKYILAKSRGYPEIIEETSKKGEIFHLAANRAKDPRDNEYGLKNLQKGKL